ncbi:hypothetical protein H2203_006241 [Taxawa tesnikishii (nom. ined.)]|nr:hypothetical protein H2203_006241 [Dothideales sp. JES 119]
MSQEAPYQVYHFGHQAFGEIKGRLVRPLDLAEVVHFRSIPYATIPERFRPSVLLDELPDRFDDRSKGDFTEYGKACPQIDQGTDPYGGPLPGEGPRSYDEWTCLNLTVSIPKFATEKMENGEQPKLPVMVYIHGGGFTEGAGHVSHQHDTTRMAALSVKEDMPVVLVSIGYRLNYFGFLNCQDLRDEHKETSSEPFPFNLGLYDQRTALQWIQKHIAGFGGDPLQVTVFGESAGASSIVFHLGGDEPLFKRAIVMSAAFMKAPTSHEDGQEKYESLLAFLGIAASSKEERLIALRAVPQQRLIDAIRELRHSVIWPYAGPENVWFSRGFPSFGTDNDLLINCPWAGDIVLGDTHLEGWAFIADGCPDRNAVIQGMIKAFGREDAERLLKEYGIDPKEEDIPENGFIARQSEEMARKWLRFGNGLEPWDEYVPSSKTVSGKPGDSKIAILDDTCGWEVRTRAEDETKSAHDAWGDRRYR